MVEIKEPKIRSKYMEIIVKDVPGYEGAFLDSAGLAGMLTDCPEVVEATRKFIDDNRDIIQPILDSEDFKDRYGDYEY